MYRLQASLKVKSMLSTRQRKVNAKSIMGMMALGLVPGQTVVSADGADEAQAIESIENGVVGTNKN